MSAFSFRRQIGRAGPSGDAGELVRSPIYCYNLLVVEGKHLESLTPRRDIGSLLSLCGLLSPEPRVDIVLMSRRGVASLRTNTPLKGGLGEFPCRLSK